MKLKLVTIDGKTYAEVDGDKPIVIHDDGQERPFDIAGTYSRMTADGRANADLRSKLNDAEGRLRAFEGLNPEDARKALETVANLDQKKLVDAGQVETIKAEAIKAVETRFAPIVQERDNLLNELHREKVGGSFARSKFIADKVAVPSDMVEAMFGRSFKVEDGKPVAYDGNGQKVFSRINPGVAADFEEALEILVGGYAHKDTILKPLTGTGSDQKPGPGAPGAKTISTADFNALTAKEKAAKMADGYTLAD